MKPCKCGTQPVLCYKDSRWLSISEYDFDRYYRYICPNCHEWSTPSMSKQVALRHWNQQMSGKRNIYWHNADMEPHDISWKTVKEDIDILSVNKK